MNSSLNVNRTHSHIVKEWLSEHKEEIEVFFLSSYSHRIESG